MAVLKGVILGYVMSESSKEPDPDKIDVILNIQPPITVKGIHRALGHFGWYRDIMKDCATPTIPLTNLTRKDTNYKWTPKC